MPALDTLMVQPMPAARLPLYAQVRQQLLARIRSGEWAAGENLPNEYILSLDFDVSIGTVRRAVADLEANGIVVRQQGRGTFVAGRGAGALSEKFAGVRGVNGERLEITLELVGITPRSASEAEAVQLPAARGRGVIEIAQRVDCAGRSLGVEVSVLPAALFPRIETQMRFGQPLYGVLADYGLIVTRVADSIGVERATQAEAQILACDVGSPLLAVARLASAIDGQAVELRSARYLPERVRWGGALKAG
jgi:GntR family transcriptional regulator